MQKFKVSLLAALDQRAAAAAAAQDSCRSPASRPEASSGASSASGARCTQTARGAASAQGQDIRGRHRAQARCIQGGAG